MRRTPRLSLVVLLACLCVEVPAAVAATPPTITAPETGATLANRSVTVAVAAEAAETADGVVVNPVRVDAVEGDDIAASKAASSDGSSEWSVEIEVDHDGFYSLTATQGGETSSPVDVTVDTEAPVVAVTGPKSPTRNASPSVTFSVDDLTPTSVECRVDDALVPACTSPVPGLTDLDDGAHVVTVKATDAAGHATTGEARFVVDTLAPDLSVSGRPPQGARTKSRTAALTIDFGDATSRRCWLDGVVFAPCVETVSLSGLTDRTHTFAVRAADAAGNASRVARTWRVDTTAPKRIVLRTAHGGDHRVVLRWQNPAVGDLAAIVVRRNGRALVRRMAAKYVDRSVFNGRRYRYTLVAVDLAGNRSPAVAVTVRPRGRLIAPADGRAVRRPPVLRWEAVGRATYYNVQLWRNGQKILSRWPRATRFGLASAWRYGGRRHSLQDGVYRWYVWPGFGNPAASRYGRLLGYATFTKR